MSFLTNELAQEMVTRTMDILKKNTNVMDESGIIIASGSIHRINQLHEGAVLVLEKKSTVEIDRTMADRLSGVEPGINVPIKFNDETVGVIGITGDPNEVRKYGELVKMAAELVLQQSFMMEQVQWKQKLQDEMVNQLAHGEVFDEAFVKERGFALGVNFEQPRVAIVLVNTAKEHQVDNHQKMMRIFTYELGRDDLMAFSYTYDIIIFKSVSSELWSKEIYSLLSKIERILDRSNAHYKIGIGTYSPTLKEMKSSFQAAKKAITVGSKLEKESIIYDYNHYSFDILLSELHHLEEADNIFPFFEKLKEYDQNGELQQTLFAYYDSGGELNETAKQLFIHRNTLRYRLDKVEEITGKNPRNIRDLLQLYTAQLLNKLR
jgi:carbohydrate diacid regulator